MRIPVLIVLFGLVSSFCLCQTPEYPVIGKAVPEFVLKDVRYYPTEQISTKDIIGKFVILDFFSKYCTSCFTSMPKMNEFAKKYRGRVDIILVGSTRGVEQGEIQEIYENFRVRKNLELPVAFDSLIFEQWKITFLPRLVWIDSTGKVVAVTNAATGPDIEAFLQGRDFQFNDVSYDSRSAIASSYTNTKYLLVDGNGGNDSAHLLFRSVLARWEPTIKTSIPAHISSLLGISTNRQGAMFQVVGAFTEMLYRYAYVGKQFNIFDFYRGEVNIYPFVVLEVADSSLFKFDSRTGRNIFSYSLVVPRERTDSVFLMRTMQYDLRKFFGYNAGIEKRKLPFLSLRVDKKWGKKLRSEGERKGMYNLSGGRMENVRVKDLIMTISGYHQRIPPIIDETGIEYNISITIDALLTDLDDIKRALANQGLYLEKTEREVLALVIRDPNHQTSK